MLCRASCRLTRVLVGKGRAGPRHARPDTPRCLFLCVNFVPMSFVDLGFLAQTSVLVGFAALLALAASAWVSLRENEPVAAGRLAVGAVALPAPFFVAGFAARSLGDVPAAVLLGVCGISILLLLIPFGSAAAVAAAVEEDKPTARIDERDIMFSRAELVPGTARFEEYYRARPENREPDDLFRSKPGLLAKGSTAYDPFHFAAADASFFTIERLRPFVDGEVAPSRIECEPETMTEFIKSWTRKLGAVDVGVAKLEEYHKYSVVGRGEEYGQEVDLQHDYAIALTVEMDKRTVDSAPLGPAAMESAQQYVSAGTIAVQLAAFIRRLGYSARAHIDGNYRVVCPLVARDAGLGELGRMGLLMTPKLGPRVRLGVVTTTLLLIPDKPTADATMIDFCERCRKCAFVCPSGAIPSDSRKVVDGVKRWQIDSEACFTLWCQLGTDCARCMKVCPYSHPDNLMHNFVRRGVRHSSLIREVAVKMDDVLHGRNPKPAELMEWQEVSD